MAANTFDQLDKTKVVALTTFKRDDSAVKTPVGIALANHKLYFLTPSDTWKVKRLRNNPQVMIAASNLRGDTHGPQLKGTARLISGAEAAQAKKRIYATMPVRWPIIGFLQKIRGKTQLFYEITPAD